MKFQDQMEYPSMEAAVEAHQRLVPSLEQALAGTPALAAQWRERLLNMIDLLKDRQKLEAAFAPNLQPDGRVVVQLAPGLVEALEQEFGDELEPRPLNDVIRAHDLLAGLLKYEKLARQILPPPMYVRAQAAADVCCWILHHDHNQAFAELLADVEERMRRAGWRIAKITKEEADEEES